MTMPEVSGVAVSHIELTDADVLQWGDEVRRVRSGVMVVDGCRRGRYQRRFLAAAASAVWLPDLSTPRSIASS